MDASIEVHFLLQLIVEIGIGTHAICALWLEIFDIDLTCDALISALHAACTLAHLNALKPRTRNIAKRIRDACTTQIWHILGEHLDIGSAQTQELDLTCSGGSIAVRHIDRRVGGERLSQVAACSTHEFSLPDLFGVGDAVRKASTSRCLDCHIVKHMRTADRVVMLDIGVSHFVVLCSCHKCR